LVSLQLVLEV